MNIKSYQVYNKPDFNLCLQPLAFSILNFRLPKVAVWISWKRVWWKCSALDRIRLCLLPPFFNLKKTCITNGLRRKHILPHPRPILMGNMSGEHSAKHSEARRKYRPYIHKRGGAQQCCTGWIFVQWNQFTSLWLSRRCRATNKVYQVTNTTQRDHLTF